MTLEQVKTERRQRGRARGRRARRGDIAVLRPRRLSDARLRRGAVPARRPLPRDPARLRADPLAGAIPTISITRWPRTIAQEARIVAQAHGHKPGREGGRRAAGLPVRAAPDRSSATGRPNVLLDITDVWDKKRARHRMHGRPGASLGILHARGAAARRAGGAQLRHKGIDIRRSLSARSSRMSAEMLA